MINHKVDCQNKRCEGECQAPQEQIQELEALRIRDARIAGWEDIASHLDSEYVQKVKVCDTLAAERDQAREECAKLQRETHRLREALEWVVNPGEDDSLKEWLEKLTMIAQQALASPEAMETLSAPGDKPSFGPEEATATGSDGCGPQEREAMERVIETARVLWSYRDDLMLSWISPLAAIGKELGLLDEIRKGKV